MTSLICAIDQGTTGTTVLLIDTELNIRAKGYSPFPQHYPKPGWVEHQPEEIWSSFLKALDEATHNAKRAWGYESHHIKAVGITNQRETTILWERSTGTPLYPAIVWQDRRTAGRLQQLQEEGRGNDIQDRTGLLLDPYFSASKMEWILSQEGRAKDFSNIAAGTVDSYLIWRLTGGSSHVTDLSNASRTMLLDLHTGAWDPSLADIFSIPMEILPELRPSSSFFGAVVGVPGIPDGTPISGVLGDQQAALFGQAAFEASEAKCTYGTGAFLLLNTGKTPVRSVSNMLTTIAWKLGDDSPITYALEGSAFIAGALVDWLCNGISLFQNPAELEAAAAMVSSSDGVLLIPALSGLGAPHWNPHARGMLRGLTRGSRREHIARAALEGIATQNVDLLFAMEKDYGKPISQLRVDGGAAKNNLLMQMQADLFDRPILRPQHIETTAIGAALVAALGAGLFSNLSELSEQWSPERTFIPNMDPRARAEHLRKWNEAIRTC